MIDNGSQIWDFKAKSTKKRRPRTKFLAERDAASLEAARRQLREPRKRGRELGSSEDEECDVTLHEQVSRKKRKREEPGMSVTIDSNLFIIYLFCFRKNPLSVLILFLSKICFFFKKPIFYIYRYIT